MNLDNSARAPSPAPASPLTATLAQMRVARSGIMAIYQKLDNNEIYNHSDLKEINEIYQDKVLPFYLQNKEFIESPDKFIKDKTSKEYQEVEVFSHNLNDVKNRIMAIYFNQ